MGSLIGLLRVAIMRPKEERAQSFGKKKGWKLYLAARGTSYRRNFLGGVSSKGQICQVSDQRFRAEGRAGAEALVLRGGGSFCIFFLLLVVTRNKRTFKLMVSFLRDKPKAVREDQKLRAWDIMAVEISKAENGMLVNRVSGENYAVVMKAAR